MAFNAVPFPPLATGVTTGVVAPSMFLAGVSRSMPDTDEAPVVPTGAWDRGEIMRRMSDAFRIRPWVYWLDLVGSACVGWGLFFAAASAPVGSLLQILTTLGCIFALLRGALFIHELAHLKRGVLSGFEAVWNALIGIPLLVPSLMYVSSHLDHHRRNGFGTLDDPEYARIARWSRWRIALFVVAVAFVPLALVLRWGVIGPLSWAFPALRPLVVERLSTLVINHAYRRPAPAPGREQIWQIEERAAAAFVWLAAAGVWLGWIPLGIVGLWFVVVGGVLTVNQVRTLAAHGYENGGEPVDSNGQLLDSINLTGWPAVSALVAPVGLRFHALHHYLPSLPYHNLGRVHRALLAQLPPDSPYRRTSRANILEPVQKLWNEASV